MVPLLLLSCFYKARFVYLNLNPFKVRLAYMLSLIELIPKALNQIINKGLTFVGLLYTSKEEILTYKRKHSLSK